MELRRVGISGGCCAERTRRGWVAREQETRGRCRVGESGWRQAGGRGSGEHGDLDIL